VIPEPLGGAHYAPDKAAASLKSALHKHLGDIVGLPVDKLLDLRYERYRELGEYRETVAAK
jgi:acetyl-CoA carboxylase carboxyl transferase subunit alpha